MKYLILILVFFVSCTSKQVSNAPIAPVEIHNCPKQIVVHDTVLVRDTIVVQLANFKEVDSLNSIIKKKNDSLFIERFRLERVKYYNRIVQRNKSQTKFLSGWISRAVK